MRAPECWAWNTRATFHRKRCWDCANRGKTKVEAKRVCRDMNMRTRNGFVVLLSLALCIGAMPAQDLRENFARSLFADQKANRVGDAVTILVVEAASASNNTQSSTSRASTLGLTGSANLNSTATSPSIGANLGTTNTFQGQGTTSSVGSITAKISARVDSLAANGNMWINGSRVISINGENQVIKVSGIIRPSDVQADNSVYSYNISDAKIVLEGNGVISNAQSPGWFTKFFHWLF